MKRNWQKSSGSQSKPEELNKRPKLQGNSDSIQTSTPEGFTDAELRRFIKSYTKFAAPMERLESIARDAELVDKSMADLKRLGELLHNSCASAMQDYEEQLKHNPPEDKGPGKPKDPFVKIGGVKVNAKTFSLYEEEMEILKQIIPADPEERAKFCLTCRAKAANFDVEWGLEDDSHLLLGTYKHGYENWELIKSDPELKLTNKILPVETDKKPQGKELRDRVDDLLYLVKKKKEKKERVKEKEEGEKRQPHAKKEKKTIKGKDEHGNEVSSLHLDKPSEEGDVKEDGRDKSAAKKKQKKENKDDQEKKAAIKKKKEDEKKRTKTKDKKEKPKGREAQGGAKGNPSQGPVCIMARSAPVLIAEKEEEGNLNVATFETCKEWMRPVKKALREFEKLDKGLSVPEQEEYIRTPVLKIGDHISECLKVFTEKEDRALWRWNLWLFVSKFTEFHARRLQWVYKMACKKRAKDEEEKKKKDEEGSKAVKEPVQPEASGTREDSVVPQKPPGPPQKIQQPPPPPPPPQTQGHQSDNCNQPNQRHFSGAEQGYWQDDKFTYYCSGNRAWRWPRHDQHDQPWRKESQSGDRPPHREPHRSWGNYEANKRSCKRPYDQDNSGREHWGYRYDRDSKRRQTDERRSQNYHRPDFRQMSDPRPPVRCHSQGSSGHDRSFQPEKAPNEKQMLPAPQAQNSGPSTPPAKKKRPGPIFEYQSPLKDLYKEPKSKGYNWNWKPYRRQPPPS